MDDYKLEVRCVIKQQKEEPQWLLHQPKVTMLISGKKDEELPSEINNKYLEFKNENKNKILCYTDGSKNDNFTGGAYILNETIEQFQLNQIASIYTAELMAIDLCLNAILTAVTTTPWELTSGTLVFKSSCGEKWNSLRSFIHFPGGIVLGQGLESSSHKYGVFQNTCVSYELVLSDASLVECSEEEDRDLFHAIPWSYGTLGFLTAVEIKIIPVKKYVQLQYVALKSLPDLEHHLKKEAHQTLFEVKYPDTSPSEVNQLCSKLSIRILHHLHVPILDYYHRFSTSLFWEIQDIVPFGNHPLFRYLLGWLMPPKVALLKLTQTQTIKNLYDKHHVVQDYLVPIEELRSCVHYFHDNIQIYPLWICPFLLKDLPGLVHPAKAQDGMYLDLGLYGEPKAKDYHSKNTITALESYLGKIRGFQMLGAGVYQSYSEFRQNYDHSLYDRVRARLGCEKGFPVIYDKVNRVARD
ncbi:delta(24)-sterol reductase-like [Diaphorina citri]|uniref:Delta(24)-sterol reductase-like n=1 Tax=Diaphorina citri TaxID=121845 RepID=A0A3Q0JD50_DIACI|nr:delta(24)-sterol reductase-like [Diaphorina citri]